MPEVKLSPERRREMILRALSGDDKKILASKYGISLQRIYQLVDEYSDPEKLAALEEEVEFRRRVLELTR